MKKKIFVSFHHELNGAHANKIRALIKSFGPFEDITLNDGTKIEDEDSKTDEEIRKEIRDEFLRDVDVTIVIVGSESINRKHIDWEIRSTIHKFINGKDGGIVVVNAVVNTLAQDNCYTWIAERNLIEEHDGKPYPAGRSWPENKEMNEKRFEWLPKRLANSIIAKYDKSSSEKADYKHAVFPIIDYTKVLKKPKILKLAIEHAIEFKITNRGKWDLNTPMKRSNIESEDRKKFEQVDA